MVEVQQRATQVKIYQGSYFFAGTLAKRQPKMRKGGFSVRTYLRFCSQVAHRSAQQGIVSWSQYVALRPYGLTMGQIVSLSFFAWTVWRCQPIASCLFSAVWLRWYVAASGGPSDELG